MVSGAYTGLCGSGGRLDWHVSDTAFLVGEGVPCMAVLALPMGGMQVHTYKACNRVWLV